MDESIGPGFVPVVNRHLSIIDIARRCGASWCCGEPPTIHHEEGCSPHFTRGLPMTATRALVSLVDDDESVRESLPDLVKELGFAARAFSSAEEFLASDCIDQTRCLILDVAMPSMSGPDLQRELALRRLQIPIVFITANGDEAIRPRVLKQGAVASDQKRLHRILTLSERPFTIAECHEKSSWDSELVLTVILRVATATSIFWSSTRKVNP